MSDIDFKPCPFCGVAPEVTKHFREDMWQLIHRCKVMGPLMIDWRDSEKRLADTWNTRAAPDPQVILDAVPDIIERMPLEKSLVVAEWVRQAADFWRGMQRGEIDGETT